MYTINIMIENTLWLKRLVIAIFILSGLLIWKKMVPSQTECFTQQLQPFVFKRENDKYDSFYLEYYDDLHATENYSEDDMATITEKTHPSASESIFLDIGCGTGILLEKLEQRGISAFGVDKSPSMIDACNARLQHTEVFCQDILNDSMLYDRDTFSHITCTHFTIYEMENKEKLFNHCFHWLKGGGFMIIHLVDRDKYTKILPSIMSSGFGENLEMTVTNTSLDYINYTYRNDYKKIQEKVTLFTETFTDKITEYVRKLEMKMFMDDKNDILQMAKTSGFLVLSQTAYNKNIKDPSQFLVVLVKPLCGEH